MNILLQSLPTFLWIFCGFCRINCHYNLKIINKHLWFCITCIVIIVEWAKFKLFKLLFKANTDWTCAEDLPKIGGGHHHFPESTKCPTQRNCECIKCEHWWNYWIVHQPTPGAYQQGWDSGKSFFLWKYKCIGLTCMLSIMSS